jgi:hypothetical protein
MIQRLKTWLANRRAFNQGKLAGARLVADVEAQYLAMTNQAIRFDNAGALKGLLLGWLQGLQGHLLELRQQLGSSDAQYQTEWNAFAVHYAQRFRSEILSGVPDGVSSLPDTEIVAICRDLDGVVEAFTASIALNQSAALDKAVAAVREAEANGTLSPDPRSDAELRESIREMWDSESEHD